MSRCAIMQPTYLPWAGYFNLAACVDVFVLLDDVQFERRSWQSRNRILLQGREHVLTVPVCKVPRDTRIADILVDPHSHWRGAHWQTLVTAYAKAPHGKQVLALLEPVYTGGDIRELATWNQSIIQLLAGGLGLAPRWVRASELDCGGQRSEHLLALCRAVGCDEYLSPQGSRAYLADDGFESSGDVRLQFQDYAPLPYPQHRADAFVSHLSLVDVVANQGFDFSRHYVMGKSA